MKHVVPGLALMLACFTGVCAQEWQPREEWADVFDAAGVTGTIVVMDERSGSWQVHNPARATERFIPASTFKIPHALFALDAGVVTDEFQVFRWDGTQHEIASWNQDQDLRASMRNSAVWVYQLIAEQIGEPAERRYLERIGYGNADPSGALVSFWLDGKLAISATEQVAFLRRLYRNELPFQLSDQRLVKDVIVVEAGRDWILRAKTGWGARADPQVGWWVGWVERTEGAVFFALNIEMPNAAADLSKRESIAREILRSIQALPPA